jgi:hypothetical protein
VLDAELGTTQATLFSTRGIKPIPPLSNDELASVVVRFTDSRIALVASSDTDFNLTNYLTRRGNVQLLDFGPDFPRHLDLNDRGRISGTLRRPNGDRAFRYVPSAGEPTVLDPLPTEPHSWAQAINRRGDVLGYSFEFGGVERIGVWRGTRFRTHFVEGIPDFPTISNRLLWNEGGLIVITDTAVNDPNSYLVPRPGVRLKLADLTRQPLPFWTNILAINENGDMVGVSGERFREPSGLFLLRRRAPLPATSDPADTAAAESSPAAATVISAAPRSVLHERLSGGPERKEVRRRS